MAAKLLNTIGKLGIGIAVAGGVVNSALYNGKDMKYENQVLLRHLQQVKCMADERGLPS